MFLKLNDILDKNDYKVTDAEVKQAFQNLGYITNTLSLKEFEKAVIAGEITDFKPYFESDDSMDNHNRKMLCIKYGVAQEFYPEWAQYNNQDEYDSWIQQILARKGYCLDILSKSNDENVLKAILEYNMNYALNDIMMTDHRDLVHDALMETKDIPLKVLKKYLETKNHTDDDDTVLELKLEAMTHTPNTIEKTMTTPQLYASNSPLWALDFTGDDISKLLRRLKDQPQTEKAFNIALYNVQNPMLVLDEYGNLRRNR